MMKYTLSLFILLFGTTSQALKLVVWDTELQAKVGWGESQDGKFRVSFVAKYNGPVVMVFSQTAQEKKKHMFPDLKNKYEGVLKDSRLNIDVSAYSDDDDSDENDDDKTELVTLGKFLKKYKLTLVKVPSSSLPARPTQPARSEDAQQRESVTKPQFPTSWLPTSSSKITRLFRL